MQKYQHYLEIKDFIIRRIYKYEFIMLKLHSKMN